MKNSGNIKTKNEDQQEEDEEEEEEQEEVNQTDRQTDRQTERQKKEDIITEFNKEKEIILLII